MQTAPANDQAATSLARSSRLALAILLAAAGLWVVFQILALTMAAHRALFEVLSQGAEAGVVGGLADWYAVTVLFRNPFGRLPLPRLISEHTEIIPRNKARIAESMGRFVQENFLAPPIVRNYLQSNDVSWHIGAWLAEPHNADRITAVAQRLGPRLIQLLEDEEMSRFIQQNTVDWIKSTPLNASLSEMLRAVLENDFHHDSLQRLLDGIDTWIKENPETAYEFIRRVLEELGVGGLARGASWLGIDVQQKVINTFLVKVEKLLADREHPWRMAVETVAHDMMHKLRETDSIASVKINNAKNAMAESTAVINFVSSALAIIRETIKKDLESPNSGLASNLRGIILRFGEHLQEDARVRDVLNREIEEAAVILTTDYSDAIINYVREHIHAWDTRDMITKIETEVGGDLHMIRVNGVVVGSCIGLGLGIGHVLLASLR